MVTRISTAQQTDMPPGMMMKTFELAVATSTGMPVNNGMSGMDMSSSTAMTPAPSGTSTIPTVGFTLVKDTLDGWDLHVVTMNFAWTPQLINQAPVANQGHAHLYIDGHLTVLFAPWYHLDGSALLPGKHVITVSLNANDHSVFAYHGVNIQSVQTVYVGPL